MGYTTDFRRSVKISPPLNEDEISFLKDFRRQRHFKRQGGPLSLTKDTREEAIDYNNTHAGSPALWMHWTCNEDGSRIEWDGAEKFYSSAEWMVFLIDNLFSSKAKDYLAYWSSIEGADPRLKNFTCNHTFNGTIYAQGEIEDDKWRIKVQKNEVSIICNKNNSYADARTLDSL